jgi:hypothetical protein
MGDTSKTETGDDCYDGCSEYTTKTEIIHNEGNKISRSPSNNRRNRVSVELRSDHQWFCVGRDSPVGIATRYGLGGPGISSWWE